jgi:hypothetical protein
LKRNTTIQIKALFLLTVFALNTVVGFACGMGVDMGFNTKHHHDDEPKASVHVHKDGKVHEHHNKAGKDSHNKKDNCCNDQVLKFQSLDKALTQNTKSSAVAPDGCLRISVVYGLEIYKASSEPTLKYIIPLSHPPPPDIRVLIQSFQI